VTTWFSNRGQAIQVTCAVVGVLIGLMAWLAVPPVTVLYFAPLLVGGGVGYLLASAVSFWAYRTARKRHETSAEPESRLETKLDSQKNEHRYEPVKGSAKVGAKSQHQTRQRNIAIVIHGIDVDNDGNPLADLEVVSGGGPFSGGRNTEKISMLRYRLPVSKELLNLQHTALFSCSVIGAKLTYFVLYVDHIDVYAKEVHYVIYATEMF
jgi:hypothetical protein